MADVPGTRLSDGCSDRAKQTYLLFYISISDGLQPNSNGLQPKSDASHGTEQNSTACRPEAFKARFPEEAVPAAPLRALRYTSAGGRYAAA